MTMGVTLIMLGLTILLTNYLKTLGKKDKKDEQE